MRDIEGVMKPNGGLLGKNHVQRKSKPSLSVSLLVCDSVTSPHLILWVYSLSLFVILVIRIQRSSLRIEHSVKPFDLLSTAASIHLQGFF